MTTNVPPLIRAMLVDDEPLASRVLSEMLSAYSEIKVIAVAENLREAASLAKIHSPNVIFLDVQLSNATGFELFEDLSALDSAPHIIFVTAFEEYAVAAFEQGALDYLLKPVSPSRLSTTIARLSKTLQLDAIREEEESRAHPEDDLHSFSRMGPEDLEVLKDGRATFFLRPHQIQAVQAEGSYTKVLFVNDQSCMVKRTLGYWEKRLPEGLLVRASRSLLVNSKSVIKVNPRSRNEAEFFLQDRALPLLLSRLESIRVRRAL